RQEHSIVHNAFECRFRVGEELVHGEIGTESATFVPSLFYTMKYIAAKRRRARCSSEKNGLQCRHVLQSDLYACIVVYSTATSVCLVSARGVPVRACLSARSSGPKLRESRLDPDSQEGSCDGASCRR